MRSRVTLNDTMRLVIVILIYIGVTGCASVPVAVEPTPSKTYHFSRITNGMSQSQVVAILGKPDRVDSGTLTGNQYMQYGDEVVVLAGAKVSRVERADVLLAEAQEANAKALAATPHELCKQKERRNRYGSLAECKEDTARRQEVVRQQIAAEERADAERENANMQILGGLLMRQQQSAPAYQPIPMTVPNLNYQPVIQQQPKRLNCTTSPGIAPGTTQTNCY